MNLSHVMVVSNKQKIFISNFKHKSLILNTSNTSFKQPKRVYSSDLSFSHQNAFILGVLGEFSN